MPSKVDRDSTHSHAPLGTRTSDLDTVSVSSPGGRIVAKYTHLPALMTVADVMRQSSLSKTTIFAALKSGRLRSVLPTPKARRIPVEWFAEWVEALKSEARHH